MHPRVLSKVRILACMAEGKEATGPEMWTTNLILLPPASSNRSRQYSDGRYGDDIQRLYWKENGGFTWVFVVRDGQTCRRGRANPALGLTPGL